MLERLTEFGLTRQEAAIYMLLYANPNVTGYEIAKLAGISRSNAYASLSSLTDKGAARLIEGMPNRYSPVQVNEFCGNKIRSLQKHMSYIAANIPNDPDPASEGYLTIQGEQNIIDTAVNMLLQTTMRVYMSLSDSITELFEEIGRAHV